MQQNHAEFRSRNADRVRVDLSAFLTFDGSPEVPVYVRDLSSCGFCCRSPELLTIGSPVTLRIPDLGQFSATVVWQLGADAGARFDSPLPLATVLSIVLAVVKDQIDGDEPDSPAEGAA